MHIMNTYLLAAELSAQWQFVYVLAYVIGAFVLPFLIGRVLAGWLRMKEYGWKIGLILCTVIVGCAIIARTWDPQTKRFKIPLGVDLQGGVILIYEVDETAKEKIVDDTTAKKKGQAQNEKVDGQYSMSALIEALSRRINPSGTKEIVVRQYGEGQVEIIIPEVDQRAVEQIKKVISTSGVLQFRIVSNPRDHQDIIDLAREMAQDPIKKRGRIVYDDSGEAVGLWARVAREQNVRGGVRPFKVDVSGFIIRDASTGEILEVPSQVFDSTSGDDDRRLQLAKWVADQGIQEIDVQMATNDGLNVTGAHLASVMKSKDEFMNPNILFNLTTAGTPLFAELTGRYAPDGQFHRQLGIVLDNELLSAPNIQEQITQHGRITGRFTEEEVQFLVNILEAGSLPVVLNKSPISQNLISPLLGRETIKQGQWAMLGATILVFLFMLVYYRFSGFLACLALVLNIVFTLAIMVMIKAPLTMPGLAGLVLTIGMSVDANVLIFERMREELARGAGLRMVIRNGFSRATATIVDANVTTILTAVILYAIGTDQLRGFAVTLILGILTSMYTAIFCARVAFDIVERTRMMSSLKMFEVIGVTNLDFISKRFLALGASAVVIILGVVGAVVRGEGLFDIDFTGGSSVHVNLERPGDSEEVRAIVGKAFDRRNIPYTLTGMSTAPGQTQSTTFKIDAKIKDVEELEKIIKETFRESRGTIKLATYTLSYGPLRTKPLLRGLAKPPAEKESEKGVDTAPSPESKNGAAADLPPASLLALAIQEPKIEKKEETSSAAKGEKDAKTATQPESKSEQPPSTTTAPKTSAGPATSPATPAEPATADPIPSKGPSSDELVEVELSFGHPISEPTLRGEIEETAKQLNIPLSYFDLTNPEWQGGSNAFNKWTLRIPATQEETQRLLEQLRDQFENTPVWSSSNKIGPQVAGRMQRTAIVALVASWIGIIIYVWVRFQNLVFGLAAVIALIHDVLVTVAALALSHWLSGALGFLLIEDFKISLTIVAALLTIIGYSINDTIVIFDRLREVRGKSPEVTADMINLTLNLTMSRTLLTAFTVFLVVIVLYGFGGQGIHGFAFSMLVGVISGTYSTIYIASPFVLWLAGKSANARPKSVAA